MAAGAEPVARGVGFGAGFGAVIWGRSMPVVYEFDHANRRIHTRCIGPVSLQEVLQHFVDLIRDPNAPEWLDVLLDLSEMTSLPTTGELSAVATQIARVSPRVQFHNCAIIASDDALFGMSRVFGVLSENYFAATRVFRTADAGMKWLDSLMVPPPGAS